MDNAFLPIRLLLTSKEKKQKLLGYCLRENSDSFSVLTLCEFNSVTYFTHIKIL